MASGTSLPPLFPDLSRAAVLALIRPLSALFSSYLAEDGVFVPEGADNFPPVSELSGSEDSEDDASEGKSYAFPDLDAQIRKAIEEYGAVFPKLNWTSPKDASWILPPSAPLKCTTPADVYLLLKSSDFVSHDLDPSQVFDGCLDSSEEYQLELVLRKWFAFDTSREFRCFVRHEALIGISQRDTNFYRFLNEQETKENILESVQTFWRTEIKEKWEAGGDYVFDIVLTRFLKGAHLIDFSPFARRTDPLLFTYEDLLDILIAKPEITELRLIDAPTHPLASRNAPANQHNMVPFEALHLSSGKDIGDFAKAWQDELTQSIKE